MFDEKRFKSFKIRNQNGEQTSVKPKLCVNWRIILKENFICLIDDYDQEFGFFDEDAFRILTFLFKNNHQVYGNVLILEMIIDRKRNLCTKEEYEEHLSQELKNNSSAIPSSSLIRGQAYVLEDRSVILYIGEVYVAGVNGKISKRKLMLSENCVRYLTPNSNSYLMIPNLLSKKVIGPANKQLISEEKFNNSIANLLKKYKRLKKLCFLSTVNPLCSEIKYKIEQVDSTESNRERILRGTNFYEYVAVNRFHIYKHNFTEVY